jgi:hypothetical protein
LSRLALPGFVDAVFRRFGSFATQKMQCPHPFETKRPRLKKLSASRQKAEADVRRKVPEDNLTISSVFTPRNRLFSRFFSTFGA